jgi:hypothetical protein
LSGAESEADSSDSEEPKTGLGLTRAPRGSKKDKSKVENVVLPTSESSASAGVPMIDAGNTGTGEDQKEKQNQVIDLNQIRSELKGLDKMVKTASPSSASQQPTEVKLDIYDFEDDSAETPKLKTFTPRSPDKREDVSTKSVETMLATKSPSTSTTRGSSPISGNKDNASEPETKVHIQAEGPTTAKSADVAPVPPPAPAIITPVPVPAPVSVPTPVPASVPVSVPVPVPVLVPTTTIGPSEVNDKQNPVIPQLVVHVSGFQIQPPPLIPSASVTMNTRTLVSSSFYILSLLFTSYYFTASVL